MKAVVFHDVGDIRLEDVPEPKLQEPTDAIVRLTASAICGTDLHMVRGTLPGMKAGTILGHEGVGVVEALGSQVRNLAVGDRVIIPSTIACGSCVYCRAGYYAQCDKANPNGMLAGTAFYGGPQPSGPFHGLQAEKARVPFAHVNLVKLPDEVSDDQAILLSDIFPTGYFGADIAEIDGGDTVAVFGCGPVGPIAIASAKLVLADRVLAVDAVDKAGTVSISGADPETRTPSPIGKAMNKSLTPKMVNCNHRRYTPGLVELVRTGVIGPRSVITKVEPLLSAIDAYKRFDRHE